MARNAIQFQKGISLTDFPKAYGTEKQCYRCHRQTSATAGTIFSSTKLPLTVWFLAFYLLTQSKKRRLGDAAAPRAGHFLRCGLADQT